MPEANEPKKETVRITLPPRPPANPVGGATSARDTVRINLPARPPQNGAAAPGVPSTKRLVPPPPQTSASAPSERPPIAKRPLPPPSANPVRPPTYVPPVAPIAAQPRRAVLPPTTAASSSSTQAAVSAAPHPAAVSMPKKETARISILPDPPRQVAPTVKMTKTQPLVRTLPATVSQPAPINVAPAAPVSTLDAIPMQLCWAVFGISAVTLLIELWNYFG